MGQVELINIGTQSYDIGRAALFYGPQWDGSGDLLTTLQHLGNTEGEFNFEPNEEFSALTIPENMGPAVLKKYVTGAAPTAEIGVFVNPTSLPVFSPTGAGSLGNMRQRRVKRYTLWVVPEQLFLKADSNGVEQEVEIALSGGVWTKDGQPFTPEDTRLFQLSLFGWDVHFERAAPIYRHEDGGKSLRTITIHFLQDLTKPDGHQIATVGAELAASEIDLEGVGTSS